MKRTGERLRIVILGMMGRCPFGGQTWLYLNWVRGLARLGHDVYYIEDDVVWPYHPLQNAITADCSYAVQHISCCMARIGLPNNWAFRLAYWPNACWGIPERTLTDLYRSCDVLLNVVGATDLREEHMVAPLRVYVECDPVIAELQLARGDAHTCMAFANHHIIATYGENFGAADCGVPLNGVDYKKTRQPIDLELWPMVYRPESHYFTTIGNYRQTSNDIEFNGEVYYWSKHHEWERYIDLPQHTQQPFELAMVVREAEDHALLESYGWRIVSPFSMSLDVFGAYQEYFQSSRAAFTAAKDQNVRLRSGWFSERDACYLASGKPVVAQDTGFSNILPTGEGLFAFRTMDEALVAIDAINSDYNRHCHAARTIAHDYFEATAVASRLLRDIGVA
jgi:hypothetical protein